MNAKELNIGDYVRTKRGIIGKIKSIDNQTDLEDLYLVKRKWYYKEDFIKSSPNIIDLIEVGDYVNGMPVLHKENDELVCGLLLRYKEENIENIVTKEQFEAMKYEIGDKENE